VKLRSIYVGAAVVVGATMGLPQSAGAVASTVRTVTDAVQVTPDPNPTRTHIDAQIARDPKTGVLVDVEAALRGPRECAVHISTDGGLSWTDGGKPLVAPNTDCTSNSEYGPYFSLAFDSDGVLDLAIEASDPANILNARNDAPRSIFLARSMDDGRTFVTTLVYAGIQGDTNHSENKGTTMAVDPSDGNHIYIGWRQGAFGATAPMKLRPTIASTADGGRTWETVDVSDPRGGDYPHIAVTSDGVVHVAYWTRAYPAPAAGEVLPVLPILLVNSTDRGKTFGPGTVIDPGNQRYEFPPEIAADPKSGALYVVWSGNADPMNRAPGFVGLLNIFFRSSTDGEKTWSDRKVLNDDTGVLQNHMAPGMAIAPNGRVDVAWYDGRLSPAPVVDDTEKGLNDVYATSSLDGGQTFMPNIRVTDRSSDRSIGVFTNNVDQRINVGVASSNDAMYASWQDSRNGNAVTQAEDTYEASVQFGGSYLRPIHSTSSVPGWLTFGAGLLLGIGGTAALGGFLVQRRRAAPIGT
jgi:hypothetical protein